MLRIVSRGLAIAAIVVATCSSKIYAENISSKYALLVGINETSQPNMIKLRYAEKDATDFGNLLMASGYEVDLLLGENATEAAIRAKLKGVSKKGSAEGVGLFGRGAEVPKKGSVYIASDAKVQPALDSDGKRIFKTDGTALTEFDLNSQISISSVIDEFAICKAGNRVLFTDCCRDEPPRSRAFGHDSARSASALPRQTAVLSSCSMGEQAFETDELRQDELRQGVFVWALLRVLAKQKAKKASTMGIIGDRVHFEIKDCFNKLDTNAKQSPQLFLNGFVDLQL